MCNQEKLENYYLFIFGIVLSVFMLFVGVYFTIERVYYKGEKIENVIVTDKYINYNTDGDTRLLVLNFNYKGKIINTKTSVSYLIYNKSKVNDVIQVFYNPETTSKFFFVEDEKDENNIAFILFPFFLLLLMYCIYSVRR